MNQELQQVIKLSEAYNLIPIVRHVMADTETPIRIFQHFYRTNVKHFCLKAWKAA